jgi:ribonuclease BN (tRNA processing enzyme)
MALEARQGTSDRRAARAGRDPATRSAPDDILAQRVMRLTVLGSGDAFGAGGRLHSAYLVEAPGAAFLLDCGPSVLQAAKRVPWDLTRLDAVMLTHLHGDHFGGVPFLFMEYRYETPRTRPLTIYGPVGTEHRIKALFRVLYERTAADPLPFRVEYRELAPGGAVQIGGAQVTAIRVRHVPELVAFAYKVEAGGRALLYSGDTAWTDELAAHARGVDLFVCECSTFETKLDIHVSYPEIAEQARSLGCRRLVLSHLGSELLRRPGELKLECARDGMSVDL